MESVEPRAEPPRPAPTACLTTAAVDLVCGIRLDPATAPERRDTDTGRRVFCSARCAALFDVDPDRFRTRAMGERA